MDKENFLKQIEQSNLSDEDKKMWREAVEVLSATVLDVIAKELIDQPGRLAEITADINAQKEKIISIKT
ncbi:MAG: hypothetical protein Q8R34_02080 [bacterium]|nr:hypothetical protein [bacterium]